MKLIKSNSKLRLLRVRSKLRFPFINAPKAVTLLLVLAVFCVAPVLGAGKYEAAGISDDRAAENFFRVVQRAVANNRRKDVANLIVYPLNVRINNRPIKLHNQRELLRRYPSVFNLKVSQAVARQKVTNLAASWRGVMIGRGELWFNQLPKTNRFKITAINN